MSWVSPCSYGVPTSPWVSLQLSHGCLHVLVVFPCLHGCPHGVPMVSLWCPHVPTGDPMFLWCSHVPMGVPETFPWVSPYSCGVSMGLLVVSPCCCFGVPMFLWYSHVPMGVPMFLWCSHIPMGVPAAFSWVSPGSRGVIMSPWVSTWCSRGVPCPVPPVHLGAPLGAGDLQLSVDFGAPELRQGLRL